MKWWHKHKNRNQQGQREPERKIPTTFWKLEIKWTGGNWLGDPGKSVPTPAVRKAGSPWFTLQNLEKTQELATPRAPLYTQSRNYWSPWMNNVWYIQTMEYYSALKRDELSSPEKTWRKLKCILLSERSQSDKATYCMVPTNVTSWKRQNYGGMKKISGCPGLWGRVRMKMGHTGDF